MLWLGTGIVVPRLGALPGNAAAAQFASTTRSAQTRKWNIYWGPSIINDQIRTFENDSKERQGLQTNFQFPPGIRVACPHRSHEGEKEGGGRRGGGGVEGDITILHWNASWASGIKGFIKGCGSCSRNDISFIVLFTVLFRLYCDWPDVVFL